MSEKLYDIDKSPYRHLAGEPSEIERDRSPWRDLPGSESIDCGATSDFTAIYDNLFPYAFLFARKFVSKEDAEDIVSSVFTKLLLKKKQFNHFFQAKAYLRACVKNACLDRIHSQSERTKKETEWAYLVYGADQKMSPDYKKEEISAELLARIYSEIDQLPPRSKIVFQLAYFEGLKNENISQLLRISINTVMCHKKNARKALRISLAKTILLACFLAGFCGL